MPPKMPILSRIAALTAAIVVLAAQAPVRVSPDAAAHVVRSDSPAASPVVLRSSASRVTLDVRSGSRVASSVSVPLPAASHSATPHTLAHRVAVVRALEWNTALAAVHGYDATAPPALS